MTTAVMVKIKKRIGNEKFITNAVKLFGFYYEKDNYLESIQGCAGVIVLINNIANVSYWYAS